MLAVITTAPRWPSPSGSCFAIAADASRSTLYVPTRYRSIVLVNPPSVAGEPSFWTTFSAMPHPPCATTANRKGASCSASSIAASALASSVTSVCTYLALGPSSSASLPARSAETSPMITDAPAPISLRTVASPSPPAPPVTRTELPLTSTMKMSSSLAGAPRGATPFLLEQFENRRVGLAAARQHRGVHSGDRGEAELGRLLAGGHQQRGRAVADLRAVTRVDHAVRLEGRLELGQRLKRTAPAYPLVGDDDGAVGECDGHDLIGEPAVVLRRRRLLM